MLRRVTTVIIFLLITLSSFGQQDPQFSQYMFDPLFFNPGYIGMGEGICATGLYRQQWVGFKDVDGNKVAPETYTIAIHAPLSVLHGGLGATITNDKLGFENNITLKLGYAYHWTTANGILSIGAMADFVDKSMDFSKLKPIDNDPLFGQLGNERQMIVDVALGAYYQVPGQYYLGLSSSQILQSASKTLSESPSGILKLQLKRHYFFTAGYQYTFASNPAFELEPSILLKTELASFQIEASALLNYNNRFWGGLSYRYQDAVVIILGMQYKNFRIGYSYDITTSTLGGGSRSSGSHELMACYCFKLEVEKLRQSYKNTRFL
jgi:type IX secretion system PorP/SprF family membrane protein